MQITLFWGVVPCGLIKRNLPDQLSRSWTLKELPLSGRTIPTGLCRFTAIAVRTSKLKGKGQGQVHPSRGHEGPDGEKRYCSTLSLTSVLDGVGGQRHAPAALPPGKRPATPCIGGWVGPSAGLDGSEKSRPHRDSIPNRPGRSELLHRLRYLGPRTSNQGAQKYFTLKKIIGWYLYSLT